MPLAHLWARVPGGTGSVSVSLARALTARPDVSVVGMRPTSRPMPDWAVEAGLDELELEWVDLRWPGAAPLGLMFDSWANTSRPFPDALDFDVIHFTAPMAPRRLPSITTATVHDVFPLTEPDRFTPRGVRLMTHTLQSFRLHAKGIAVSSDVTRAEMIQLGFAPERLRVLPLAANVSTPDEVERRRMRAAHHLARPFLLWVGTIEPRKNVARVLEVAGPAGERGVELVMVGPTGWGESGRQDVANVRWLGRVSDADLQALYAEAEGFVFPSLAEGFGLPVLEAMAHGTPVVTSSGTATEEVAGGAALLVEPDDSAAIVAAAMRLLDEPELREDLARRGRERAAAFSWERYAGELVNMWESIGLRPEREPR